MKRILLLAALACLAAAPAHAQRARDLGVPFEGTPGPLNAITDVAGVEVGHTTLIEGSGRLVQGRGPVRTGVTAILPRGRESTSPVFGAWFTLNAAGEMTGTTWLEERGLIDGPIMITNTHSVGVVRDAAVRWMVANGWQALWHAPVAAETYDGVLNDINGFHVTYRHALAAIEGAHGGAVGEGAVGGGTGMICNGFKGGIGTASRRLPPELGGYTVGVLVQCNYGSRRLLRVAGAPVGADLVNTDPICYARRAAAGETRRWPFPDCDAGPRAALDEPRRPDGSIIIVVATDAPLLPHQLRRLAKRPSLGLGRLGSVAGEGSGDIFVAFSTANPELRSVNPGPAPQTVQMLSNDLLTPLFEAGTQATEEAVVNAMVAAETMEGVDGVRVPRLPHEQLRTILRRYGRLTERAAQ
ncbi:MAG TPA: P1 family peptidase [Allosphingosinicella sp.]|jgi:L-aminopeptidase/D-esterase-like protein|nr:P1 family peptidase [Allosphingosinicella sp.]